MAPLQHNDGTGGARRKRESQREQAIMAAQQVGVGTLVPTHSCPACFNQRRAGGWECSRHTLCSLQVGVGRGTPGTHRTGTVRLYALNCA